MCSFSCLNYNRSKVVKGFPSFAMPSIQESQLSFPSFSICIQRKLGTPSPRTEQVIYAQLRLQRKLEHSLTIVLLLSLTERKDTERTSECKPLHACLCFALSVRLLQWFCSRTFRKVSKADRGQYFCPHR